MEFILDNTWEFPVYYHRTLIDKQIVYISFIKCRSTFSKNSHWYISVVIASKKKNILKYFKGEKSLNITGKIGIKGLVYVKNALLEFEKSSIPKTGDYIIVNWLDNKRRNAYMRLLKYGYNISYNDGHKSLCKKITNSPTL